MQICEFFKFFSYNKWKDSFRFANLYIHIIMFYKY